MLYVCVVDVNCLLYCYCSIFNTLHVYVHRHEGCVIAVCTVSPNVSKSRDDFLSEASSTTLLTVWKYTALDA